MVTAGGTADSGHEIDLQARELTRIVAALTHFYVTAVGHGGKTLTELSVLRSLYRIGGQRISDLAQAQGVSQPGMTQLIARLEAAGLAQREHDPSDGRVVLVTLTEQGRHEFERRNAARTAEFGALLRELDADDRERLVGALPVIARMLGVETEEIDTEEAQ